MAGDGGGGRGDRDRAAARRADAGFILTFGATAALLEGARRARAPALLPRTVRSVAIGGALVASIAVEIALMPVCAQRSRASPAPGWS